MHRLRVQARGPFLSLKMEVMEAQAVFNLALISLISDP
jgi:hypothetical protein